MNYEYGEDLIDNRGGFGMTKKSEYFGINIIRSGNLPLQLYNEKEDEWDIIHMTQIGNTIYVSMELFKALEQDLQNRR